MSIPSRSDTPSDHELSLLLMTGVPPVSLVFQAIVDLNRGSVAGYEVLARFPGPITAPPDRWVAAATRLGKGHELEVAIWEEAFAARHHLPAETFMSINASPDFLASSECATLIGASNLDDVVIEVTEHEAITDYTRLSASLSRYRARGAAVAVDDAGSGYANMSHVLALRPEFIKLDRAIITYCDRDPAKAALIEMLGSFAERTDSRLIAEGVEREAELATLMRMNIPLGQGYYLATPQPEWSVPASTVSDFLANKARLRGSNFTVESLTESVPAVRTEDQAAHLLASQSHIDIVVLVDDCHRPIGFVRRDIYGLDFRATILRIPHTLDIGDAVLRAMTRDTDIRFDPIICTREDVFCGLIRLELLVEHLARREESSVQRESA